MSAGSEPGYPKDNRAEDEITKEKKSAEKVIQLAMMSKENENKRLAEKTIHLEQREKQLEQREKQAMLLLKV